MTIKGYTYSHKWGAILNSEGRAVADRHSHIGGNEWEKLQSAAYQHFYDRLKVVAGYGLDETPAMMAEELKWKLPEGAEIMITAEIAGPKKKWWRKR